MMSSQTGQGKGHLSRDPMGWWLPMEGSQGLWGVPGGHGPSEPQPGAGQPQPMASGTLLGTGTGWDVSPWVGQQGRAAPGVPAQGLTTLGG